MSKKLYIADTHFGHANVLKLDERPFNTIEEHDEELICRWNNKVDREDHVYIVGDFCWKKSKEWPQYLQRLNGHKHLLLGNHDGKQVWDINIETRKYFDHIDKINEIKDNGRKVILCHYPIPFYRHSHMENVYMLCGHVHSTREWEQLQRLINELNTDRTIADFYEKPEAHSYNRAQIYNIGAMMPWMDFTPQTLDEIIEEGGKYVEM